MRRLISKFLLILAAFSILPAPCVHAQSIQAEEVTLPNGWKLTPAGRQHYERPCGGFVKSAFLTYSMKDDDDD